VTDRVDFDLEKVRAQSDWTATRINEVHGLLERARATRADVAAQRRGLHTADADESERRIAQVEEMVARTHDRAAEMYENWVERHVNARFEGLEHRARRHRELAAAARSIDNLAERTVRGFEARVEVGAPVGKARQLVALSALQRLRVLLEQRIEETVVAGRREGASWAEIATALRVTRQTAHGRYRHRAP
jgi:hypothetical protein